MAAFDRDNTNVGSESNMSENPNRSLGELHSQLADTSPGGDPMTDRIQDRLDDRREELAEIVRTKLLLAQADEHGLSGQAVTELAADVERRQDAIAIDDSEPTVSADAIKERLETFEKNNWDGGASNLKDALEAMEAEGIEEMKRSRLKSEFQQA